MFDRVCSVFNGKELCISLALGAKDLVVAFSIRDILWIFFSQNRPNMIRQELQEDIDWECDQGNENAVKPLVASESIEMDRHESSEELSAEDLDDNNDGPHDDEWRVGGDAWEDVHLVINLSGANHVEDLHENEQVEHHSQVSRWSVSIKELVHALTFSVFHHANDHIELTSVPLFFKTLIEVCISIIFVHGQLFDLVEVQYFFGGAITEISPNFSVVFCALSAELLSDELISSKKNCQDDNGLRKWLDQEYA